MLNGTMASSPISLKVDASFCNVRLGQRVSPRTIIGEDFENGDAVQAGCYGQVTGVEYSGSSPIMTVFVQPDFEAQL